MSENELSDVGNVMDQIEEAITGTKPMPSNGSDQGSTDMDQAILQAMGLTEEEKRDDGEQIEGPDQHDSGGSPQEGHPEEEGSEAEASEEEQQRKRLKKRLKQQ